MQNQNQDSVDYAPKSQDRRKVIKKISIGIGVLAGYSVLPQKWTAPIVGQIALPAHATTSGPAVATQATDGFNTTEEYSLRPFSGYNNSYTWLNQTGSAYGGEIKFVYSDGCGELVVPNAAVSHGADGNTGNHNQAFYFCGTDFPSGSKENNGRRASVFSPPGCKATSVTLHYNK